MKKHIFQFVTVLTAMVFIIALVFFSCEKLEPEKKIKVETVSVSSISVTSVGLKAVVLDKGEGISEHGFCYSTEKEPDIKGTCTELGKMEVPGDYSDSLSELSSNTTYYIRAYAMNSRDIAYGKEQSFKTLSRTVPVVTTISVTNIQENSVVAGGKVISNGGDAIVEFGIIIWEEGLGIEDGVKQVMGSGFAEFSGTVAALKPGTIYHFIAFASNSLGTGYGAELVFTTSGTPELPGVISFFAESVTLNTAIVGGDVINAGSSPITETGIYYGLDQNVEISGTKLVLGSEADVFSTTLESLTPNSRYFFKAFATNNSGTSYGKGMTFLTMTGTVADIDDNVYFTISMGDQLWMATNLQTTRFNDDTPIPLVEDGGDWAAMSSPAFCSYDNIPANGELYGTLYNWHTVGTRKLCPEGWHVPSDDEWIEFEMFLGISGEVVYDIGPRGSNEGSKIAGRADLWEDNALEADPLFGRIGFNVLPGGKRVSSGDFGLISFMGGFWTNTNNDDGTAMAHGINTSGTQIVRAEINVNDGRFIRCVEGPPLLPPGLITSPAEDITDTEVTIGGDVVSEGDYVVNERGICYGQGPNPETNGTFVPLGSGQGVFSTRLTGLEPETKYYYRAYANYIEGMILGEVLSFTTAVATGTVTDYDGNVYSTVQIGNQLWMAENLKVTHFRDGTNISLVSLNTNWMKLDSKDMAYCWFNNAVSNKDLYGGLYTWTAAMNGADGRVDNPSQVQGVCPDGWHLPSNDEWKELEVFLGMTEEDANGTAWRGTNEGGKLKEAGFDHWVSPNTDATNETGFTGLPGGYRVENGIFYKLGYDGTYWSATAQTTESSWTRGLGHDIGGILRTHNYHDEGYSVRCLKNDYITNFPQADFSVNWTEIQEGTEVSFTDLSTGPAATWHWDFGDGGTSGLQNPSHIYETAGNYSVSLTISNSEGTDTESKIDYITVSPAPVTDYDGNVYQTVQLGAQVWMAENLRVTHFPDGSEILLVDSAAVWIAQTVTDKAYCYYDNSISNRDIYGALYTWAAAMNGDASSIYNPSDVQGVCPDGWHLPSYAEWTELVDYLIANGYNWDGTTIANKVAKSLAANSRWNYSSYVGTAGNDPGSNNSSGFSALPAGTCDYDGSYVFLGLSSVFWTATESDAAAAWYVGMDYDFEDMYGDNYNKDSGISVRCVKDPQYSK